MEVLKIGIDNFEEEVLNSDKPVLIDFYADWCGPCKMMSPIIEELANKLQDKVKVCKINIDENQNLAIKYNVMSIPTIVSFENGKENKRFVGVTNKEEILSMYK